MKTNSILPVLIILVAVFNGCSSREDPPEKGEVIPVKVLELKKEKVQNVVDVSGFFTTNDETSLSFKTGGIVKSIFVNEGDRVKKGQLLAALELNEIQAQVSQARSAHKKTQRDFNRVQNLYRDSVATLAQMQDAKTGLDIAAEQLKIANYNLGHSEIRAVNDGYVLKKFVNPGQLVGPGTPVLMTNNVTKGDWILKAGISDHDWSIVKLGDPALVQSDVNPSQNIEAVVLRKSEGVDPSSGTFFVELKIAKNQPVKIASGLFGKAEIYPDHSSKMWAIPYQSVMEGDGNSGFVFVTNNLQTAHKVPVSIFTLSKDSVFINSGLDDYKYLIVSGSAYLNDRSEIKVDHN